MNQAIIPHTPSTPQFDMRVWFYEHIDKLITWNTNAALNKQAENWYRGLEALSGKLTPMLTPKKQEDFQNELDDIYQKIYDVKYSIMPHQQSPISHQHDYIQHLTKTLKQLRAYDNKLFVELHGIGMLLPKKPDLTRISIGTKR